MHAPLHMYKDDGEAAAQGSVSGGHRSVKNAIHRKGWSMGTPGDEGMGWYRVRACHAAILCQEGMP